MPQERLVRGLVQVYTGDGKGKTTCALGLALRAVGQGFKVAMVQFLKGRETGESRAALQLAPDMSLSYFGRPGLVNLRSPAPEDVARVREAWDLARRVIEAGAHDLVILDEINLALAPLSGVVEAVNSKVLARPDLVHDDPYGEGWLMVVNPTNLKPDLDNLLFDQDNAAWIEDESHKLLAMLEPSVGATLQSDGTIVDDVYGHCPQLGWTRLVKEFLRSA
jgi:cob(I)alamin adenosyltransferase